MMEEASRIKTLLAMNINYAENRRRLTELTELIRERWRMVDAEKWRNLVDKVDMERDPKSFWKEVNRMFGRSRGEESLNLRDEHGRELETGEEVAEAFRRRLEKTFRISEENNEDFDPTTEREVQAWL